MSFPTTKALALTQDQLLGVSNTWFFASLLTICRFGIAALTLLALSTRTLRRLTRSEVSQGVGLGVFGGIGILLQVDGMAYTAASTSAFLTQGTCLFIPLYLACREWRRPAGRVLLGCSLVIAGAAVLAGVDWQHLRMGRGELETLAAAELTPQDFVENIVVKIADEVEVDVSRQAWQVSYSEARATAEEVIVDGVRVPFLGLQMLIKSKTTYREQDRADLVRLRDLLALKQK